MRLKRLSRWSRASRTSLKKAAFMGNEPRTEGSLALATGPYNGLWRWRMKIVRRGFLGALMTAWLAAGAGRAAADIVVNHPPLNSGGPAADTEFINDSNMQSWQLEADDFQVTQDAVIRRISWWGFYGSSFLEEVEPPPATETMRARIYGASASDGLPDDGNIVFEESIISPSREPTGRIVFVGPGPPEFKFEVDLATPLAIEADMTYWLEIIQVGDINSLYRWEVSQAEQNGHAFMNSLMEGWRRSVSGDLAFELSTIPEPSSLLLIAAGFILWGRGKR